MSATLRSLLLIVDVGSPYELARCSAGAVDRRPIIRNNGTYFPRRTAVLILLRQAEEMRIEMGGSGASRREAIAK